MIAPITQSTYAEAPEGLEFDFSKIHNMNFNSQVETLISEENDTTPLEKEISNAYTEEYLNLKLEPYISEGKYKEAINLLNKAIKLNTKNAILYFKKGLYLLILGEGEKKYLDESINCNKKGLELIPDFMPGYANIGACLFHLGKEEEAVEYYKEAIKLDPYKIHLYRDIVGILDLLGKDDEASNFSKKAIEMCGREIYL